jgi:hypothetical protein
MSEKCANNGLVQRNIFDEFRCNASASPSRFMLDQLTGQQVAAIVKAVLADKDTAAKIAIRVPVARRRRKPKSKSIWKLMFEQAMAAPAVVAAELTKPNSMIHNHRAFCCPAWTSISTDVTPEQLFRACMRIPVGRPKSVPSRSSLI